MSTTLDYLKIEDARIVAEHRALDRINPRLAHVSEHSCRTRAKRIEHDEGQLSVSKLVFLEHLARTTLDGAADGTVWAASNPLTLRKSSVAICGRDVPFRELAFDPSFRQAYFLICESLTAMIGESDYTNPEDEEPLSHARVMDAASAASAY